MLGHDEDPIQFFRDEDLTDEIKLDDFSLSFSPVDDKKAACIIYMFNRGYEKVTFDSIRVKEAIVLKHPAFLNRGDIGELILLQGLERAKREPNTLCFKIERSIG